MQYLHRRTMTPGIEAGGSYSAAPDVPAPSGVCGAPPSAGLFRTIHGGNAMAVGVAAEWGHVPDNPDGGLR
ncbi:MAG: hypothetical protein PHI85_10115 [Victivallaceae bacterium]|nr:hypothetical protein [Victivallaceae bacterium]